MKLRNILSVAAVTLAAGPAWAACGLSDTIDVTRLSTQAPAYAAEVIADSRAVLPGGKRRPSDQIRASLNIAMIGGRYDILAYRDAKGWRVDRRFLSGRRSAPGGAATGPEVRSGRLSKKQVAQLEAMLGAPCLWKFPPYLPNTLPMKDGQDATCMDGAALVIEIRSGRRRWVGAQECQIQGTPGDIYNLLNQAKGL